MTVRVGFLGAGLIANWHAGNLRAAGVDVEWVGVHDPDRARACAFSEATGAPVLDDEATVVDRSDAVYVCTWTSEHLRLVDMAAARGVAVFCEKPLSTDLAGAIHMTSTASAAGITNQVGLVLRASPAFCWLRHLVTAGDGAEVAGRGRIMSITLRDDQYIPMQGMYQSTWRGDVDRAGAGVLLEHSIHDVDLLEHLAGPVTSVSALSSSFHAIEGIEDSVAASMSFTSGAVGTMVTVWHDVIERLSHRRVEVFCERMWCALDGSDWLGPVRWMVTGEPEQSLEGDALAQRVYGLGLASPSPDADFIAAVAAARPATPDFTTALRAHVLVDAMYHSAAAGGDRVAVP